MTLALSLLGRDSIWLLTDRRLSCAGRPPVDTARKVVRLETTDGVALLGYSGLGATAIGTEPSAWMSRVLRGRNMPLEHCLAAIAGALRDQFPRYLSPRLVEDEQLTHQVLVPAIVNAEIRLYAIMLRVDKKGEANFEYSRPKQPDLPAQVLRPPVLTGTGSGAAHLERRFEGWRHIVRLVRAYDRGLIRGALVADELARVNHRVHRATTDGSVGPDCIVVWQNRPGGRHREGHGLQFYEGTARTDSPMIPTISRGGDLEAIISALLPDSERVLDALLRGEDATPDTAALNRALRRLPRTPDEDLE